MPTNMNHMHGLKQVYIHMPIKMYIYDCIHIKLEN